MRVKSVLSLIFSGMLLMLLSRGVYAYTLTCGTSGCSTDFSGPIFSETNIYPVWSLTKTLTVQNNYPETRKFSIQALNIATQNGADLLAGALNFSVREKDTSKLVYGPVKLSVFKVGDYVTLSDVNSGASRDYLFEVSMDNVGNEFQNQRSSFDLRLGFDEAKSEKVVTKKDKDSDDDDDDEDGGDDDDDTTTGQVAGTSVFRELAQLPVDRAPLDEPKEPINVNQVDLASQPQVAGASTCVDPWWWFLVFFLQGLVHAALIIWVKKYPLVQIAAALPFMYVFWQYFCPVWDVWVSAFIGAAFWAVTLYLSKRRENVITANKTPSF